MKEEPAGASETDDGLMVLDATAEFCRTLGDIPTYGLAGNRDTQPDLMVSELLYTEVVSESRALTHPIYMKKNNDLF